jgi:Mg2+-importing ATPase
LTALEAQERLKQYGFNEPVTVRRTSLLARFLSFFGSPLSLILLVASIVTGILGDPVSATIIAAIVVASATLDFVQTLRSQNAADKLRNQVVPTATCLRDGQEREVPRRQVVPGDVIRLIAGDLVPADARSRTWTLDDAVAVAQAVECARPKPCYALASCLATMQRLAANLSLLSSRPVLDRFGQVRRGDVVTPGQVGNRPRDFEDAMERSR